MGELDCRGIEERLPWLLNGTLSPAERREVELHLAGCAACEAALAATRRASALFEAHPEAGTLVDYAFGLPVEAASRAALELHLAHCPECQEELRFVAAEREGAAATAGEAASPRSRAAPARSRAAPRGSRALALAAMVAVSSGLAVYVAMRLRSGPPEGVAGRVAVVELSPESSRTRGGEGEEVAIRAAVNSTLLLVTDRAEAFEEVRARIVPRGGGRTLREVSGLLPALGGGYALLLPARSLPVQAPAGTELEIELEGRIAAAWSPIGRYRLRVEP